MKYDFISTDDQLVEFCREAERHELIAFDTEFVSEDRYRPDLCIIQVALGTKLAIIDALTIHDITPFWRVLSHGSHASIVHSGREEFLFCRAAVSARPSKLFDTQVAAAFLGLEYPAAYSTLVNRILGKNIRKGETRTNWRQRPLSKLQLDYAVQDVVHLVPIYERLCDQLRRLDRLSWLQEETDSWQHELEESQQYERWRRVSGTANLTPRALAIVRSLYDWRDAEARSRDCPARRVLRDDLIVELARRQSDDIHQIKAIRGMERGDLRKRLPQIAQAITRAIELPDEDCPAETARVLSRTGDLLAQFLAVALSSICRRAQLAPSLVGTLQDVKDLVMYHLGTPATSSLPALAIGWRKDIVGKSIEDLLAGRVTLRIGDISAENPLILEPRMVAKDDRTD